MATWPTTKTAKIKKGAVTLAAHHHNVNVRSITWPVHKRSPKITRNNFLTPNCIFTMQLLWAMMTIKGSLYWSISMLKRFLATKNLSPVKNGSKNGDFLEI